jgi:integrase
MLAEFTLGRIRPQALPYPIAVKLFLEEKGKNRRQRTVGDYERLLGRLPFKSSLAEITHDEVARQLRKFKAPSEYNHILVALRIFMNFCVKRRYIEHNPTVGLSQHSTQSRSRTLTDREIIAIWQATKGSSNFNTIVRLLLLTGQRVGEISKLQSSWINDKTITIPASVTKNRREHSFPVEKLTRALLASFKDGQHFLFPARGSNGTKPFNGWSKSKSVLDKISGVKDWTLHDIRRTYASIHAKLGTPIHVIEKLLNHVSGQISGVAATYNRYDYMDEMRAAVDRYERHLQKLL